ncbi:DUF2703 domain-containing protein [Paracoccus benzoatiresistens]|uniref:DUF2703 domain-containing protein n=1 Tax=Paracoccus benzoatiresistens TaxID=2997341 RepID=A0ABT4JC84_9RHOB|nr:DUF2703 domain-containing protein [Paracoccus sp. EF6]MCZ0964182.1 DUF2703 domain-containing protein [Paracoccus sp. EF6]
MRTLPIVWQRLVGAQGTTCPRCRGTGEEVRRAVAQLRTVLESLGIEPVLEEREIDQAAFLRDPLQSNQVLISGRPLDDWLGGRTGSSRCCNECGDRECRTLEVDGQTYETIPEDLVLRAGLIAAAHLPDAAPCPRACSAACCDTAKASDDAAAAGPRPG